MPWKHKSEAQKEQEAKNVYNFETRMTKKKNEIDENSKLPIIILIIALIFFICAFCLYHAPSGLLLYH